jgi:hypothetical protein
MPFEESYTLKGDEEHRSVGPGPVRKLSATATGSSIYDFLVVGDSNQGYNLR